MGCEGGVVRGTRPPLGCNAAHVRGLPDDAGGAGGRTLHHQARGAYDVHVFGIAAMLLVGYLAKVGDRPAPFCPPASFRYVELRFIEHVVRNKKSQWIVQGPAP